MAKGSIWAMVSAEPVITCVSAEAAKTFKSSVSFKQIVSPFKFYRFFIFRMCIICALPILQVILRIKMDDVSKMLCKLRVLGISDVLIIYSSTVNLTCGFISCCGFN
jgi:hypothetical protein